MHADKCPICEGNGWIETVNPTDTVASRPETCHGCNGLGWVSVRNTPDEIYKPFEHHTIPITTGGCFVEYEYY